MRLAKLLLTARDFDAYAAEKAKSNAYSRPRLDLKQRALAWASTVARRLEEGGLSLEVHGSDEFPSIRNGRRVDCQWVWLWRTASERAELEGPLDERGAPGRSGRDPRHALLGVRVDASGVLVCIAVHAAAAVDLDNLRGELAARPTALLRAIESLPEEFSVNLADERLPSTGASAESLVALVERAGSSTSPLWIGWTVPRETAIEHADGLDEQLEDALVALGATYRLVAWSRGNDHIGLAARLDGPRATSARASVAEATSAEPHPVRAAASIGPGRARVRDSIERGARVRVRSGPFAERIGSVSDLDGRGGARVMLGLLSARFELDQLEPVVEGRERAAFQSSHRRPQPQLPRKGR